MYTFEAKTIIRNLKPPNCPLLPYIIVRLKHPLALNLNLEFLRLQGFARRQNPQHLHKDWAGALTSIRVSLDVSCTAACCR